MAIVNSQDSLSLKHIVENMVWQLIGNDLVSDVNLFRNVFVTPIYFTSCIVTSMRYVSGLQANNRETTLSSQCLVSKYWIEILPS